MTELRKMARDAGFNTEFDDYVIDHWQRFEKLAELIKDAALAQPEQEPVAWMKCINIPGDDWDAYDFSANQYGEFQTPLYTAPPQRKPLTDEEMQKLMDEEALWKFARAIEKAHGIR